MELNVLVLLVVVVAALLGDQVVTADFFPNRERPKEKDLEKLKLKCIPGRTRLKMSENTELYPKNSMEDTDLSDGQPVTEDNFRRTHMTFATGDESCQVCVCSVQGTDEYCSNRTASNVNECIRMSYLETKYKNALVPFDHIGSIHQAIRRDYVWHRDELPYAHDLVCARGASFYTNNPDILNATIDISEEIDSLLDFEDSEVCNFCVCSAEGYDIRCIPRSNVTCEYMKQLRNHTLNKMRQEYAIMLGQDRPRYFQTLSYQMRRGMDKGVYELLDSGGDALCCNHPDGHRRSLHHRVKNRINQLRMKVQRENLMGNTFNQDYQDFIVNND